MRCGESTDDALSALSPQKLLWSETYNRKLTDIFAVQDEIAQAVVAALKLTAASFGDG